MKCKRKRDMKNEKQVTMKNGRLALSGTCTFCGTKMFKIGGGSTPAKQRPKVKAGSRKPSSRDKIKQKRKASRK